MQSNKISIILSQFNLIELNRLRKFISSPYFNKSDAIVTLFDILTKKSNQHVADELSKETIWQHIYATLPYNDTRFRKLCSDLLKLVENFLTQEELNQNPVHQANYLLSAVTRRKLDKLYNSSVKSAKYYLEQEKHRNSNYYYHQYLIENNYYMLADLESHRSDRSNVEDIINNLDFFYLAEKMRLYCTVLSRNNIVSHEYKVLFIDEIIEHVRKYKFEDIPPISIYYKVYQTQHDPETQENYYELIAMLRQHEVQIPVSELQTLYSLALNYCIYHINRGRVQFANEYFTLGKYLVETEILFNPDNGELSPWHFKNIILIANRLKEYDWVEAFIYGYKDRLPASFRENAVTYNLAQMYFYKEQYDKVVQLLQQVEYEDLTYNLGSKTMLIAVYYETKNYDVLESLLDSFGTFLNRHKDFEPTRRARYQQLIRFVKRLLHLRPGDKKALTQLKTDLENAKNTTSYNWLLQRIEELEKEGIRR